MDFAPTPEQKELRRRVLSFARVELSSEAVALGFDRDRFARCGAFGLLGLSLPERYGGSGEQALSTAIAVEAFGEGCADFGLVFSASAHLFACAMPIFESGDEALREHYLPRLAEGVWVGANAITESEAGSDVFAMKTRARRDGDAYVLDGSKVYVTNAPEADVFLVYASTAPEHGYMGVSAFVLDRDTPGLSVGPAYEKLGLASAPMAPLYLDGCRVSASRRLGAEGTGALAFRRSMHWERACLFAGYVGALRRALDQLIEHARSRRQFGRPIGSNQAVSHRIVDLHLRVDAARLLLHRACWMVDQGLDAAKEISMAKIAISESAIQGGLDLIHVHGGLGFVRESGLSRLLTDAVPSTLFSGTSEMQRDIIAKHLGL